jgi:acetylornithine deacetylase/succinyl-diaminopimelate desuccinylase-like protein
MDSSPFGATWEVVYGRAACYMKAGVVAIVMAGAAISGLGIKLRGDLKVAAVARKETGGAGTIHTIEREHFLTDTVLIGEATNMGLALRHRWTLRASIVVRGRSCHASIPDRGVNTLYGAADLLRRIRGELVSALPEYSLYGRSSIAVTTIEVTSATINVVPEACRFGIDCRNSSDYPPERLRDELEALICSEKSVNPELDASVLLSPLNQGRRVFTVFMTEPDRQPVVGVVENVLAKSLGKAPRRGTWAFATDGRMYSWMGLPVVGFGLGEKRFAHTVQDHVRVEDYIASIKAYATVACRLLGRNPNHGRTES